MRARANVMLTAQNDTTIEHDHEPSAVGAGDVREVALDAIEPDPGQPRRVFDDANLRTLAASIAKYGLLQEPGVVPLPVSGEGEPRSSWSGASGAGAQAGSQASARSG